MIRITTGACQTSSSIVTLGASMQVNTDGSASTGVKQLIQTLQDSSNNVYEITHFAYKTTIRKATVDGTTAWLKVYSYFESHRNSAKLLNNGATIGIAGSAIVAGNLNLIK